ncbi:hypothetical protein [Marinifilum sp. D714]|uniref:hypothetical protein n=1 Tax=Marinifilum sp. D714 TaxID=2937523 RepID=UPI0027C3073F|nr:hypothetical protein [Marinifilum sp. D714]MDQ2178986.1 hypothetical protein [Marinifilum sp. D714]
MKLRIKNTRLTILILAYYQIIGGIIGLYLITKILFKTQSLNGALLFIFLSAIGLYFLSIKSGSLLIRKENKRGLIYSMIHQLIQIIGIGFGGNTFVYYSGAKFTVGPNFTDGIHFKFDLGLLSQFDMSFNLNEKSYFLYVNILALFILYVFWDLYKELILVKNNPDISLVEKKQNELNDEYVI